MKNSVGGEVYAFSEMVDHTHPLRGFYDPFAGVSPGTCGLEDCERLLTHLGEKRVVAENYLARHFLGIRCRKAMS